MDKSSETKQLCRKYDIKPARSKGQNFLIDDEIYNKIIDVAELNEEDTVLEVGPGLGFLTERLAREVKRVIAVELDGKLAEVVKKRMTEQELKNVEVVNEDILEFRIYDLGFRNDLEKLNQKSEIRYSKYFKIVANLPYNITSRFLRTFLSKSSLKSMTLLLQKEVAERITAKPGKMSLLAVSVQFYSEPKIIDYVSKKSFWPEPEVDSAIVEIKPHPAPPLAKGRELAEAKERELIAGHISTSSPLGKGGDRGGSGERSISDRSGLEKEFFRMVRIGFSSRRKMLKNNLAGGYRISTEEAGKRINSAGFSEKVRAQELSVNDWVKLFENFK